MFMYSLYEGENVTISITDKGDISLGTVGYQVCYYTLSCHDIAKKHFCGVSVPPKQSDVKVLVQ